MKVIKTASNKKQIVISRKEWKKIGETAGWDDAFVGQVQGAQEIGKVISLIGTEDYQPALNRLSIAEEFIGMIDNNHPVLQTIEELKSEILKLKDEVDKLKEQVKDEINNKGIPLIEKLKHIKERIQV
ncbi:MAG: hypothetical protein JSW62_00615 [Thermoplasmatales archaeon]|nr:MAG: hypothetical protein JSW62_00615 [Thermoplasmatales archaeon]